MSTLYVDNLQPNLGSQVEIPALKPLAGSVVQYVHEVSATTTTLTTSGIVWTDVYPTATITPTSASNLVLVMHDAAGIWSADVSGSAGMRILRSTDNGSSWSTVTSRSRQGYLATGNSYVSIHWGIKYTDSPATTSAIIYKMQIALESAGNLRHSDTDSNFTPTTTTATTILMEIAQ